ncbi:MAG TPA: glycosyltransferase [Candidatus Saccharimonadales bacterium]
MKTSFVVIAYNEARNIERTISAILAQDGLKDFEVVVVNDGSKDDTLKIVQQLAKKHKQIVIVDQQPNQGRGAARAAGVAKAKGDYLAFVDADITLPAHWYKTCLSYMKRYDACGGIAVPDGDVAFVYRACKLNPKVAAQTTTITGNNGMFKRAVFDKVSYNPTKKNGEDVALGFAMVEAGFNITTINDLTVEHHEVKSYAQSLSWLFESGVGSSRQFYEHPALRLPDLAFFGFVVLLVLGGFTLAMLPAYWWAVATVWTGYVSASSFIHLFGKFYMAQTPLRSIAALCVNDTLLTAYYFGRLLGMFTEWRKR